MTSHLALHMEEGCSELSGYWGLLVTAPPNLLPPKRLECYDGGRAGTLIPDFLTLNIKGEMLEYVFVLTVMGAPQSRRHLTNHVLFPVLNLNP